MNDESTTKAAPKTLTQNDLRLLSIGIAKCVKDNATLPMDFKLLAEYVPYKNASTANACWRSLMKKLATFEGADPTAPSAEKSNGAQKNGGGGDDGEVPGPNSKKRARGGKGADKGSKKRAKKNEVEVKEEEDTFSVAAVKDSWEEDEDDLDAEVKEEAA